MDTSIRFGDLSAAHAGRIATILRATRVFSTSEIAVALELLTEPGAAQPDSPTGRAADRDAPGPNTAASTPIPDYSFLGAFTPDDELVGYACYGPTPGTDRTFDLYWIAVHPAAHGTGIGTSLLSEVERRLEGQRARMLVVETSSRSEYAPTRGFYARRGYAAAARVREFYAPLDDRIIFTKRLHHSPTGRGAQSP